MTGLLGAVHMGPFGRLSVGSIASKDGGKNKDAVCKEGNRNKKQPDGIQACKEANEDVIVKGFKKDTGEKRSSSRLFSWNKDDSSRKINVEKVERGRRLSSPGKVQTTSSNHISESSSFLSSEFGFALGLTRIKTRSGPLYTSSTRSGPVFAGTLQSRFNIGHEKREKVSVKSNSKNGSSSRSPVVRKPAKAAKIHARDSVSPKGSFIESGSNCRGRSYLEAESRDITSSINTGGSSGSSFVAVSKLALGSDIIPEGSLSETSEIYDDVMSPSGCTRNEKTLVGQVSQAGSASSWVYVDSNFDTGSSGGNSMLESPVGLEHARSVPVDGLSLLQGEIAFLVLHMLLRCSLIVNCR